MSKLCDCRLQLMSGGMVDQEQAWINAAVKGNREAFGHLVSAYQVPVHNLTFRMLGNAPEAEDAAQESFLRAYSKLHTYSPDRKFSTWLLSIASHHCIDRLRRRRFTWVSVDEPLPPGKLVSGEDRPEDVLLRREQELMVRRLLQGLDSAYRAPVVLRYWYDLSYQEIAETLGISVAAVKSRLHRARLKLASSIEQEEAPQGVVPDGAAESHPARSTVTGIMAVAERTQHGSQAEREWRTA